MIRDKNVEWLEARAYIPWWHFTGWVEAAGVLQSAGGAATVVPIEIGTSGITAAVLAATSDILATLLVTPYDLDRSKQVRFRVWWSHTTADADSPVFTVTYTALDEGGTIVAPVTALSTAIAADLSSGVINAIQVTDFGVLNKNVLLSSTAVLALQVQLTALGGATAGELRFHGLEVRYTPRRMAGPEKNLRGARRLATASPLGVALHTTQEG